MTVTGHTAADMSVRTDFVALSIVSLGILSAACSASVNSGSATEASGSGAARPIAEPSPAPIGVPSVSWLKVAPEQGTPNSAVSLDVACLDNLGAVQSQVLDVGQLQGNPEGHQPWRLYGTATVRPDAAPGSYRVSATCGASELATDFTVAAGPSR